MHSTPRHARGSTADSTPRGGDEPLLVCLRGQARAQKESERAQQDYVYARALVIRYLELEDQHEVPRPDRTRSRLAIRPDRTRSSEPDSLDEPRSPTALM